MTTKNQFKTENAARAAVKKAGLGASFDVIHDRASSANFTNGYFFVVFYCDGYEGADEDRDYIRGVGFRAQKWASSDLGYKKAVVFSHRAS